MWVSGSSETKTYGTGITMGEHKELHTLPRRHFFGKDRGLFNKRVTRGNVIKAQVTA